jgi:PAS domain S-box-containing protein
MTLKDALDEAQRQLQRSDRRFRSILRNSSDIVVVVGADSTLLYAAPSVRRLLNLPPDAMLCTEITDPVHPDDVTKVRESLANCAAVAGEGPMYRCRLRYGDGSWHTFEVIPVNLLDDPDVEGIVLNARDVTERERAEAELRRRDAVLEAVRIATQRFLMSQSSWRTSINEVMALLGRAASVSRVYIFENFHDADGELWAARSHEWVRDGIEPQIDNAQLNSQSYVDAGFSEIAHQLGSGEVVSGNVADLSDRQRAVLEPQAIVSLVLMPVFVAGQWWGFLGFDDCEQERDWSAAEIDALRAAASTLSAAVHRQRAEDELREQQAQYRQVFEATGDGLVITDLDTRLVRANPAFYRIHGYEPGELYGHRASDWIHPDFHQTRDRYTAAVLRGERPRAQALDVRKDGSTFPVQVHGSAFTFQGRPHVLGVVRDDTERTRAFELLEKRIAALSDIAAILTVNQRLTDTMDVITRAVIAATPAIACSAYVVDAGTGELRVSACTGLPNGYAEAVELCWREEPNLTSRLRIASEPLIVRDAVKEILDNPARARLHDLVRDVAWDVVAAIPFELQGRGLGSVNAYYPEGMEPSTDDLAFLRAVADQGTVAVENTRLLAEAQSKAGIEERQRLARELHDSVSQALYGIALGARTAKALAKQSTDQLAEPLDYILSLAQAGMAEMRSLIFELRPESLANEGLVVALEKRVAVLRTRHQLLVEAELCAEPRLPPALKETLYRIAQEALHNAVKHAHADQVELRLAITDDSYVELEVADDGVGFEPADSRPGHLGLQSMRERTATHRGSFELSTRTGAGTLIRVRLPIPE